MRKIKFALLVGLVLSLVLASFTVGLSAEDQPTYTFATEAAWAPWDYVNDQGDLVGFDIDVIRAIAEVEGFNVKFKVMSWGSLIPAVKQGKADMTGGGMSITPTREEQVDFTDPYWFTEMAVLVRENSDLNIFSALTGGKTISNQRGTTGAAWVKNNLIQEGYDVQQKLYETYPQATQALLAGKVAASVQDLTTAKRMVDKGKDVKIAGTFRTGEAYGYAVQEGNDKLLKMLNDGLEKIQESGKFNQLLKKYELK